MNLPTSTTENDIEAICRYLLDKPDGADILEATAVFAETSSSNRKLVACRLWGFVEKDERERVKITDRGRSAVSNSKEHKAQSCFGAISEFPAYMAVIRKAVNQEISTMAARDVSVIWKERFSSDVSNSESIRIEQAICFFNLLEGAGLGETTIGSSEQTTKFAFDAEKSRNFLRDSLTNYADAEEESTEVSDAADVSTETVVREVEKRKRDHVEAQGDMFGKLETTATSGEAFPSKMELRPERPMLLPSQTTQQDIDDICNHLMDKPAGATVSGAAAAFKNRDKRGQKRATCRQLGFVEKDTSGKIRITDRGRNVASGKAPRNQAFLDAISSLPAYRAVIEKAVCDGRFTISVPEVYSLWQKHFPTLFSKSEVLQTSQAICLFHVLEGASLGEVISDRPVKKTQFAMDEEKSRRFIRGSETGYAETQGESLEKRAEMETSRETVLREGEEDEKERTRAQGEDSGKPEAKRPSGETLLWNVELQQEPPMPLPSHTTIKNIDAICNHLLDKPAGATVSEATAVFGKSAWRGRKREVCMQLGFIEKDDDGRIKITERGRRAVCEEGIFRAQSCQDAISGLAEYRTIIKEAASNRKLIIMAPEVISLWRARFPSRVSKTEKDRSNQAICFFRLLKGAALGEMTMAKRGRKARFAFQKSKLHSFAGMIDKFTAEAQYEISREPNSDERALPDAEPGNRDHAEAQGESRRETGTTAVPMETGIQEAKTESSHADSLVRRRVYITYTEKKEVFDQVRELVAFGKFESVPAREYGNSEKAMNDMRSCRAAVIHADTDRKIRSDNGKQVRLVNETALIEIGTAMALYGHNIILIVEDGVELPSALHGLQKCQYSGKEIDGRSIMKLLRAFNDFDFN